VPWDGDGLRPVGYGYESIEALVQAARRVNAAAAGLNGKQALETRRRVLREIDERAVLATPGSSWINELVTEAARLSIACSGRPARIEYTPTPTVRLPRC
jgi:D-galacturonate reductase